MNQGSNSGDPRNHADAFPTRPPDMFAQTMITMFVSQLLLDHPCENATDIQNTVVLRDPQCVQVRSAVAAKTRHAWHRTWQDRY